MPNFESICPTDILEFPPASMWGLILTHTSIPEFLFPNSSKIDRLSMLIFTPKDETSSISLIETPFGVYIIFSALKPQLNANFTSCIDTASIPDPKLFKNLKIDIFDDAFTA